ncbi:hypothetical protein JOD43_002944 [Pullulanibacillus pueri]|uniref:NETI motif-containing protein n=1 Tax=Pullulanibacillus pueri TaxID=1437324 RepID=A0A8J2ZWQ8_9BACL|nr:NETI motif-containing protein [Pullulanibacillus pueri]MBM7682765.1 hypothetical protein [Pullulanibacillus pueri]GGH83102.1 NETI motif-containing protein [Pullulanibacillus pueri]
MKRVKPKKKQFDVSDYGSIGACLDAMKAEGYTPVRRLEKPIFKEGEKSLEIHQQVIIFEGKLIKTEQ